MTDDVVIQVNNVSKNLNRKLCSKISHCNAEKVGFMDL